MRKRLGEERKKQKEEGTYYDNNWLNMSTPITLSPNFGSSPCAKLQLNKKNQKKLRTYHFLCCMCCSRECVVWCMVKSMMMNELGDEVKRVSEGHVHSVVHLHFLLIFRVVLGRAVHGSILSSALLHSHITGTAGVVAAVAAIIFFKHLTDIPHIFSCRISQNNSRGFAWKRRL